MSYFGSIIGELEDLLLEEEKKIIELEKGINELYEFKTYLVHSEKKDKESEVNEIQCYLQPIKHKLENPFFQLLIKINGVLLKPLKKIEGIEILKNFSQNLIQENRIANIENDVLKFEEKLKELKKGVEDYNYKFIEKRKKDYAQLFNGLEFSLDEDQKTAIIRDDKHNLVVAGAGSGKTEVLTTRIAYLVNRVPDKIGAERILALAYQNKDAKSIESKLKQKYGLSAEIKTFHALGRKILNESSSTRPVLRFDRENADSEYTRFVSEIFNKLKEKPDFQKKIINYMARYKDEEYLKTAEEFQSKKEYYEYMNKRSYPTFFDGIVVKSEAERDIMNFFFCHNLNNKKIDVKYEFPAEWMSYEKGNQVITPKPDFFLTGFGIYIENWGLDKGGRVPEWFHLTTEQYVNGMNAKKKKFEAQNEYSLVEMYSWEFNETAFIEKLKGRLLKALKEKYPGQEFAFSTLSYIELTEKIIEELKEYNKALPYQISSFIKIAKTNSLFPSEIKEKLSKGQWTPRQISFAELALDVYSEYQRQLSENNWIDFEDMINKSVTALKENKELYRNAFDQILIDEYQDISPQRFELINQLMEKNPNCKIFCVGDDWQSIMGFSGADLDYFVNFEKYFDHPARTDLSINYRSNKTIVDAGATLIKYNGSSQLEKRTIASNKETELIEIYSSLHENKFKKQYCEQIATECIKKAKELHTQGIDWKDMLILSRIIKNSYLFDPLKDYAKKENVPLTDKIDFSSSTFFGKLDKPNKIPLISVHKSKGAQAKIVFILNVDKDLYGFPCELENPDIFEPAKRKKAENREEEERRLFYVAITRAREKAIIFNQKCKQSKFVKEISQYTKKQEISY